MNWHIPSSTFEGQIHKICFIFQKIILRNKNKGNIRQQQVLKVFGIQTAVPYN